MKTHKVIDLMYEERLNGVYAGTYEECVRFVSEQGGGTGYEIILLEDWEYELENM